MSKQWWENDPIATSQSAGGNWWENDPVADDKTKRAKRAKRQSQATAMDYARAIDTGLARGVAGLTGGIGTFIQAPAANTLAGVAGAAHLADRGVTWLMNQAGADAEVNPTLEEHARQTSRFAAEARDANAANQWNLPARFGRLLQKDSERALGELRVNEETRNPELIAQQQNMAQAEGFVDNLAAIKDNPLAFTNVLARSLPDMALGVGVGSTLHRTGAGLGRVSTAGALSEAGSAALQGRQGVYEQVAQMPLETLAQSPRFQEVLKETGGDAERARMLLANELADQVPLLTGAGTALGTVVTNRLFGGDATAKTIAGVDRMTAKEFGKRTLQDTLEEGFQGLPEDAVQHGATVQADPSQEYDPGGSLAQNLAAGFAMGAGGHGYGFTRDNLGAIRDGVRGGQDQTAGAAGQTQTPAGEAAPAMGSAATSGAGSAADVETVGVGDAAEAERALREPVNLTALDRANEIDTELTRIAERLQELAPENGYGPAFDLERDELGAQARALAEERNSITRTWPRAERGAPTTFSTEAGVRLEGQYALMDADDLVTSHDESLRPNPLYPQELQPRDRSRSASELQVSGIVQKLDPARLGVSADAATGAPIVGADGLVESGNARTIALKRVYQANGQKAEDYKQFLRENASQFGIDPAQVDGMAKPVLVRVRQTPVNRAEFARQANASTVQRMSPSEQALSDAKRLTTLEGLNPDEDGNFTNSMDFIRQFMATLPVTEQSDLIESDGRLSTQGYRRIQNAVLAKAYGDSPTLRRMTESLDNNLRNISNALTRVAPTIAAARERMQMGTMHEADIAPDLIQAVEGLSALKDKGWTVADELGQQDLAGPKYSPEAADLLQFLSDNARSPRRIAEFIQRYYEALEQAGDPSQGSMFGDEGPAPTRAGLLNAARGGAQDGYTAQDPQRGIDRTSAAFAAQDGRQPQDAPGDRSRDQGDGSAQPAADGGQQEDSRKPAAAARGRARKAKSEAIKPADATADQPAIDREKLDKDFRTFPTLILNNLLERGQASKLYKAAGTKGASAFEGLAMDDKAAAYVKFVEQGGKPVENLPKDYNAWVRSQERDTEVRRLQSDRVVRQENGKPFKTKTSAQQYQERYDLTGTHEVVEADGGFELRQLSPSAQTELKRKAEGRESYTEAQAAVAAEMGIGQTPDGEWDVTDEQFDELERRTQARMRGEPVEPLLTAPTAEEVVARQDAAEAAQREAEAADRKAAEEERKRQERAEIARRSEAAADTLELGQDPMVNLTGQRDIFSAAPEPEAQADDGITIKPGKGLIKGKFLAEVDGDGVPGGPWDTEAQARTAAEAWKQTIADRATENAAERARRDRISEKFRNGEPVSNAEIESLGLKTGTSDMRWFISTAANLFGLKSRDIRPIVKNLIRTGLTDMGAKREFVPTRQALEAIARKVNLDSADGNNLTAPTRTEAFAPATEADPFDGLRLPDQVKEYLLKPSVTLKDGKTVSPKEFVDGLLAEGYGNPEYFAAAKGSQVGFISKPGSPRVTLNDKQMFYADAAFMAKKKARKGASAHAAESIQTAPSRADALAEREQIRRESEVGASQFRLEAEDGRQGVQEGLKFSKSGGLIQKLRRLFALATSKGNDNETVVIAPVSTQEAALLQAEGIQVDSTFRHVVDLFAVRHAINRHGDAKVEAKRGQLPLTEADIAAIPSVIERADALLLGAKTPRGQDIVGNLKRLPDGTILYLEEVRSGRKTLAMTSMRKYPGTTDFETIRSRIVPSYAQSDTGDIRIIYPDGGEGQGVNFSRTTEARDLVITHNLTAENLLHAVKMGGLAVPSLAVTKKDSPLTNFGEITLIGDKAMADPNGYAGTKVFGADIYSPRYPSVERDLDHKAVASLNEKLRPMADRMGVHLPSTRELQSEGQRAMERNLAVMGQFLQDRNIEPALVSRPGMKPEREARLREFGLGPFMNETDAWNLLDDPAFSKAALAEIINAYEAMEGKRAAFVQKLKTDKAAQSNMVRATAYEIANAAKLRQRPEVDADATRMAMEKQIADAGLANDFQQYVLAELDAITKSERIFQGFTYSGNRKYIPHTLENVVKLLKKDLRGGENVNYGVGPLRAKFTPQFKSVADIRKNKNRLITAEQFESVKNEIDAEFLRVSNAISPDISSNTAAAILEDAAKKGVRAAARGYGYELSGETEAMVASFLTKLRTLPTAYFEAKIPRAVSLSEFRAAVVPEGVNPKVLKALEDAGVKTIRTYPEGDKAARRTAIEQTAIAVADDVLFSRNSNAPRTPITQIRAALTQAYGRLLPQLEARGLVTLAQSVEDAVDAAARARVAKNGGDVEAIKRSLMASVKRSASGDIQGFFDPASGQAFLVADSLTAETAPGVLMHEVGVHMANDGTLEPVFKRADVMIRAGKGNPFFDDVRQRMEDAGETSPEEAAAYLVEAYERNRTNAPKSVAQWLKDVAAAIRAWLFKKGVLIKADDLTAADIAAIARASARELASGNYDPANPGIRLARGPGGGGLDVKALNTLVGRIQSRMPNLPKVHVLADPSKAPKALREYINRQDAWDDVEGAFHEGELYLFASGLSDTLRAEHVLAEHEAAHFGLRAILGDKLKTAMNLIYANNASVRRAVADMQKRGKLSITEAVEEVIVDIPSAALAKLKGWRRVVQMAADWLGAHGFERMAQKLADWLDGTLSDQQRADLFVAELVRGAREYVAGKRPGSTKGLRGTRLSATLAEDIAQQEQWLQAEARARGFKDIEDLLAKDYPLFAGLKADPTTALSRADNKKTAAQRADDIIADATGRTAALDAAFKTLTRLTGIERLAGTIYDRAAYLLERITPEKVKAGIVADYGVPEAVIDQRVQLQGRQRVQLRKAGQLIDQLSSLTRAESRVAYEWMNMDGSDPKAYLSMMHGLPEESVKVLQEVQKMIDQLSKEAVRLGQLSPEAYERNRFAYLRRSYAKHILEQTSGEKAKRARVISILGDQYKGRGMTESAAMAHVQNAAPEWWGRKLKAGKADVGLKGQKFLRLERRAASGEGTRSIEGIGNRSKGKLLEVAWWPADEKIPPKYAEWDRDAAPWEVRDTKGGNLIMWRDFTKDERQAMGEVDEARFAIAKTLQGMIHDVEVGRYLEWLAMNQAKKEGEPIPGVVVEASERYKDTFAPGEWVRVPDTKISGTNVHKYGKLAGRYLPGPVWNDVRQAVNGQFKPFGETYAKVLLAWKLSKTALSPAVHMNNIMSNFIMADWHDVGAKHIAKALRIILAASQRQGKGVLGSIGNAASRAGIADREAAREILNRYADSGGGIGSWVNNEIQQEQLAPLMESLEKELRAGNGDAIEAQTGVFAALQHMLMLRFPQAWEAFKPSLPGRVVVTEAKNLIDLYQHEDDVFRLAAWLKAKEEGLSDIEAGKRARKSFLDYHINAPWIQAMRQSFWPFISFTYRAVPMLLETAGKKPHKLLKLMMVLGALNALGMMMSGGDDDERKLLPEEKAGRIWGIVPKLIRMPWNDDHGSPVYLDIRRFVPVGDVFDVGAGHAAIPMFPGLMPGGPLVIAGEVIFNKNSFTGKPITLETDTGLEKATKLMDHLYKAFMPNIVVLPNTYAFEGVMGSLSGRTDAFGREMSTPQAVASAFGIKLGSYPSDVLRRNELLKSRAQIMEIQRNISQLRRQRQTNRITQEEFARKMQEQQEKQRRIMQDLAEKLQH